MAPKVDEARGKKTEAPDRDRLSTLWLHGRDKLEGHQLRLGRDERSLRFGGSPGGEAIQRLLASLAGSRSRSGHVRPRA